MTLGHLDKIREECNLLTWSRQNNIKDERKKMGKGTQTHHQGEKRKKTDRKLEDNLLTIEP